MAYHDFDHNLYSMSLTVDLFEASEIGNIEKIKYCLDTSEHQKIAYIHYKEDLALIIACHKGQHHVIKFLLESPEIKEHCYINGYNTKDNEPPLAQAAFADQFLTVKFLLTSPELKQHADLHAKNDMVFRGACRNSNFEMIDYLLNSPELNEHIDVSNNQDMFALVCRLDPPQTIKYLLNNAIVPKPNYNSYNEAFFNACSRQNNDTIDYLFEHPDYYTLLDLNYNHQGALEFLIKNDNLPVIGKLFREYDISLEPQLYALLKEDKYKHIIDIIDKNILYRNLNNIDYIDDTNSQKTRLKI